MNKIYKSMFKIYFQNFVETEYSIVSENFSDNFYQYEQLIEIRCMIKKVLPCTIDKLSWLYQRVWGFMFYWEISKFLLFFNLDTLLKLSLLLKTLIISVFLLTVHFQNWWHFWWFMFLKFILISLSKYTKKLIKYLI